MAGILEKIKSLSPCHCIICTSSIQKPSAYIKAEGLCICADCYKRIERYLSPAIFQGDKYLDFIMAAFPYEGELKKSFLDYKFKGQKAFSKVFGKLLENEFDLKISKNDFDVAIPVPLSCERERQRGYNQTSLMFCNFIEKLRIEYREDAMFRTKNTLPQSTLSIAERNENIKDAFLAQKEKVQGKRVLLLDDIYTRGATMRECAKTLKNAGAKSVAGVVLMKTHIAEEKESKYRF